MALRELFRQAKTGEYTTDEGGAAQCVLGFSFGVVSGASGFEPGESNVALARFAREHFPDLPMIFQRELADAMMVLAPSHPIFLRIGDDRPQDHPPDTRGVAVAADRIMRANGWKTAVILAQGNHVPRAVAVCKKLRMGTVVPPGLRAIPFCPRSLQPWTRDSNAWFRREALVIPYYRLRGWI